MFAHIRNPKRFLTPVFVSALALLTVCAPRTSEAIDAGDILKAVAVGAAVNAASEPLDDFINTVTANRGVPVGADTRVVPVISVGEKAYVGAAQIVGSTELVNQVEAVYQYQAAFDGGKYRLHLLFPNHDINPLNFNRVEGVGISAAIDLAISGDAPALASGGVDTGDALRAVAIGAAITAVDDQLNSFINKLYGQKNIAVNYATKVVPRVSVGERAYIGGVQIVGPADAVNRVKAAFQIEQQFDNGKWRVSVLVPVDTLNPLKFSRVKGVGISAVIDTTIATDTHVARDPEPAAPGAAAAPAHAKNSAKSASSGDASDADAWIDRAHEHINATKKEIDSKKSSGKGKGKGKDSNSSAANKRLADARKRLAEARHARAQGEYGRAVDLARQSMAIADDAKTKI